MTTTSPPREPGRAPGAAEATRPSPGPLRPTTSAPTRAPERQTMTMSYDDIPGDGAVVGDLLSRMLADGMRSVFLVSATGTPTTMLARRLLTLLDEPTGDEADVIRLAALEWRARFGSDYPEKRPFRAPHHTVSRARLLDSARCEYRAAAAGVLYLDEVTEFRAGLLSDVVHRFHRTEGDPYAPRVLAAAARYDETRDRPAYRQLVERIAEHFDVVLYVDVVGRPVPRLVLRSVEAGRLSPRPLDPEAWAAI